MEYFGKYGFELGYFTPYDLPFFSTYTPFMALINLATGELLYKDSATLEKPNDDALILELAQEINAEY